MAGEQHQLADAEARRWWSEREFKAEKDMALVLHKRMEAQRAQIHAFKLEQSKWEHELQVLKLRISKYAHDRKLLSEHNIELQEARTAMEERYTKLQRENDLQAAQILELEGQLVSLQSSSGELRRLQGEVEELSQHLLEWESLHQAKVAAAVKRQEDAQNELIIALETKLEEVSRETKRLHHASRGCHALELQSSAAKENVQARDGSDDQETPSDFVVEATQARIAELEKACKQKDQTILSLRSMLERHETISDTKSKLTQAKYEQVKAINISLQKKLLHTLTSPLSTSESGSVLSQLEDTDERVVGARSN